MVQKLMFEKILVANRGEIAVRIMRSAQELHIKTVAIYEETDKDAFHITQGDEAICVGPGPRKDYLSIGGIIDAAKKTGAQAIHPGYGFLAENPDFSQACTEAGLVFIGPPPEVIRNLASDHLTPKIAEESGIPVIPATDNLSPGTQGEEEAIGFAERSSERPCRLDDVFNIMSVTKAFTDVVLFSQIEEGRISLTTRVNDIIPEFKGGFKEQVTIFHLMTHSAGSPPVLYPVEEKLMGNHQAVFEASCKMGVISAPGRKVEYSCTWGHVLLGEIIRRVDGGNRNLRDIYKDRLFGPL